MIQKGAAFILLLLSFSASAEYRVYQYLLKPTNANHVINDVAATPTLSTLAPVSFKAYNGGHGATEITLMRTWMCPGNTGARQDYCPHPSERGLTP